MDLAIRGYSPYACLNKAGNMYEYEQGRTYNNYRDGGTLYGAENKDTVRFSLKSEEDIKAERIEEKKKEIEERILISRAQRAVRKAKAAKEAANQHMDIKQGTVEKVIKNVNGQGKELPKVFHIYTVETDGKKKYCISKNMENNDTDNNIMVVYEKIRSCYAGKQEKDEDLIFKNMEIKSTSGSDITDFAENCTAIKGKENEYISYDSLLHNDYDGKPEFYATGYEHNSFNGIDYWDGYLLFDERTGEPKHYYTGMTISSNGFRSYDKHLECVNGEWEMAN